MLEAHDLVTYYGHFMALGGISFEADTGICLVTGPNGAGKTTLLRSLAGLIVPARGQMALDGVNLLSDRVTARRSISYLPDSVPLYSDLTVSEHLTYRARLKGFAGRRLRARLRHVAEAFELRSFANFRTSVLSAGQRRLVGLADAFLSESRLLILDEPFADLDEAHARVLSSALAMTSHHAIVVVATHSLEPFRDLEGICLVLSSGTLVGELPISEPGTTPFRRRVEQILHPSIGEEPFR